MNEQDPTPLSNWRMPGETCLAKTLKEHDVLCEFERPRLHSSIGIRANLFGKDGTRFALRGDEGQTRLFRDATEGLFICFKMDKPTDNITQRFRQNVAYC